MAPASPCSSAEPIASRGGARTGAPVSGLGAATLTVGAAFAVSAAAGRRSDAWYVATGFEKHRVLDHGLWSLGAMTIGLAVLPVVATVAAFASLLGPRDHRGPRVRHRRHLCVCCVRRVRRSEGRVSLDGLLPADRRTQCDLPRTCRVRRDRSRSGASDRDRSRARGRLPPRSAPRPQSGVQVDQSPYFFEAPSLAIGQLANRNFIWPPWPTSNALS